jgi:hypothetical protein
MGSMNSRIEILGGTALPPNGHSFAFDLTLVTAYATAFWDWERMQLWGT